MSGLGALLSLAPGCRVAVVGCNGKTTAIRLLAQTFRAHRVLVTPTTKIRPMRGADVVHTTLADCHAHRPRIGIQCFGEQIEAEGGAKLASLPLPELAEIAAGYDFVFMEADGSRSLPCKGWRDYEPVIPAFTTHTLGIVTTAALGRAVGESSVQRIPEFSALTGLAEGDIITLEALAKMICAPGGMFARTVGKSHLLISHVEAPEQEREARALARLIRTAFPGAPDAILCGSAIEDRWQTL